MSAVCLAARKKTKTHCSNRHADSYARTAVTESSHKKNRWCFSAQRVSGNGIEKTPQSRVRGVPWQVHGVLLSPRRLFCHSPAGGHPCAYRTENQQRHPSDTRRRQAHDTTIVLVATCILVCTDPFKLFEQFSDCAICRRQEKKARPLPKFSDHSRAQLHSSERKPQRECSHPSVFPGGLAKRERETFDAAYQKYVGAGATFPASPI